MSMHNTRVLPLLTRVGLKFVILMAVIIPCVLCMATVSGAWATSVDTFNITGGSIESTAEQVSQLKLNRSSFTADGGEIRQLVASGISGSGATQTEIAAGNVVWSSSNEAVATVDANGAVKTVSPGTATITCALVSDSKISATCEVTVISTRYIAANVEALQSPHPYAANVRDCWQYTHPLASELLLEFDARTAVEDGFDYIEVSDADGKVIQRFTGTELASQTIWVESGSACVRLVSDEANDAWGFAVVSVTPIINDGWYEVDGKVYFYRDNEIQKGIVDDGGILYYFDEETGEYVGPATIPEPEPEPEPTPEEAPKGPEGGGPAVYKMPYLLGQYYNDAENLLAGMGFTNVTENWIYDDFFKSTWGTVISTTPVSGADIAVTEEVNLEISQGPSPVWLPDVTGMLNTDAMNALTAAGFLYKFEAATNTYDPTLINHIAWQDPAGNSYNSPGTTVGISVYVNPDAKG